MEIEFTVQGIPKAKGRPRFYRRGNFVGTFTDKQTKAAEDDFKAQAIKFRPKLPLDTPLILNIVFASIKPKSAKKRVYWTVKPDLDNLVKLVKDALNGIMWQDDSQIIEIKATKIYSNTNHTFVRIEEIV